MSQNFLECDREQVFLLPPDPPGLAAGRSLAWFVLESVGRSGGRCGRHTRSMGSPQAVIFDNDGLLLDTEDAWTRAEETLFARRGREFTIEHKRSLIGSAHVAAAKKLESMLELAGEGEALMDELHELVMEEALAGVEPRPGALELLEQLLGAGVPIAVASNSQREFVQRTLAGAGLLDGRFQTVVSAEDVEHPKPAPDIYLEACRRLDVKPGMCTALEDSPTGIDAAVAAGMYVIGVPYVTGAQLPECDLLAESLADPKVAHALGLG
jgi:HAD superfamily hydrolase (TIGR01509 family)